MYRSGPSPEGGHVFRNAHVFAKPGYDRTSHFIPHQG
jgi:hypothetical protein